ncbi:MAG: NGG1p interacting factor NIF3 [Lentisphaeria bacterium]
MAYYRLDIYVPENHLETLKTALFAAGAGCLGNYDSCCFQSLGSGQFRPSVQAKPFLGEAGKLEQVQEWKLEMIFSDEVLSEVLAALRKVHPYETPAFQYWRVEIA